MEEENKQKMTFSERRANSAQAKLVKLREKMMSNPPKTFIGKKLAIARLNRLSNIVDRRILRNNIEADYKTDEYKGYETYYSAQESLMGKLSNLHMERESILRQLENLERFDPNSSNFMYAEQQQRVAKNMPKGYEPKTSETRTGQPNVEVVQRIQMLEQKLEEIEEEIARNEERLEQNDAKFNEFKAEMKQQKKEDLALVSPNLFTRIGRFFSAKGKQFTEWVGKKTEQFKQWKAEKSEQADADLFETMERSVDPAEERIVPSSGLTQEEQAENARRIQEKLQKLREEQGDSGRQNSEERQPGRE